LISFATISLQHKHDLGGDGFVREAEMEFFVVLSGESKMTKLAGHVDSTFSVLSALLSES
jgi:hypothetical protein